MPARFLPFNYYLSALQVGLFASAVTRVTTRQRSKTVDRRLSANIDHAAGARHNYEERHVKHFHVERLEQASGDGHSERGLLQPRAGTVRPDVSTDGRLPRLHDHREDQAGDRRGDPRLRQEDRRHDRREPARARPVAAPLPAMGALRHRSGEVLHVPRNFRHRFRQVHGRRGSALQSDRCRYHLREARRISDGLEDERPGVHQLRARAPVSELPRVRRIPVRVSRRNQKGAGAQAGLFVHARSHAVNAPAEERIPRCWNWTTFNISSWRGRVQSRRDTGSSASGRRTRGGPGCPASSTESVAVAGSSPAVRSIRDGSPLRSPGPASGHWVSTTRASRLSLKSFVKGWLRAPRSLAIRDRTIPTTGWGG